MRYRIVCVECAGHQRVSSSPVREFPRHGVDFEIGVLECRLSDGHVHEMLDFGVGNGAGDFFTRSNLSERHGSWIAGNFCSTLSSDSNVKKVHVVQ
jgi:hypothetical protein